MNALLSSILSALGLHSVQEAWHQHNLSSLNTINELRQWAFTDALAPARCKPQNVHIAYHNEASEMTVMWMTAGRSCRITVHYGIHDSQRSLTDNTPAIRLNTTAKGTTASLSPSDMCEEPATSNDYHATWHHTVILRDLEPSTMYTYCVGEWHVQACNSFTTAPQPGSRESFSFLTYGDMGVSDFKHAHSPGAQTVMSAVLQEVQSGDPRFIVHMGDVSYGDGKGAVWHEFMKDISPFAARVPYLVGIGNHDYDYKHGKKSSDPSTAKRPKWAHKDASNGECGVALAKRFAMPQGGYGELAENSPFWYSFEHGPVHFVLISSENSLKHKSKQWKWLAAHLAAVDRCRTPWLVLGIHRPLYVIHPHHKNRKVAKHLRHHIEDLLLKYGVDIVVSGHVHSYSRSHPVVDKEVVDFAEGSVLHVITGSGGHKLSKISHHQPKWVAFGQRSWGFSRFTVDESDPGGLSRMTAEFVTAEDGAVRDSITLDNSLRRERQCSYCYSRSNGTIIGAGVSGSGVSGAARAGSCAPSSSIDDLEWLQEVRLAREPPQWASVLREEMPEEWMRDAAQELDAQSSEHEDAEGALFEDGQVAGGSVMGSDVAGDSDDKNAEGVLLL